MINYRIGMYIFLTAAILLFIAAVLSPHEESALDIVFFALSIVSATMSVSMLRKHREEKRLGMY
jgi:hypothetical protein